MKRTMLLDDLVAALIKAIDQMTPREKKALRDKLAAQLGARRKP